jgi:hypothetical protein
MDVSGQNYPTGPSGNYNTYNQNQSYGSTGPYSQTYLSSQMRLAGSTGPMYSSLYEPLYTYPATSSSRNNIFSYLQNILTQTNNTDSSNNNMRLFEFYDISNNSIYEMDYN